MNKITTQKQKDKKFVFDKQKHELLEYTMSALHYTLINTDKGRLAQIELSKLGITREMIDTYQIGLGLKDTTILARQITNNQAETIPLALKMGLLIENNGQLEGSVVGIIKPFRNSESRIVGFETFTSKNIDKLADELLDEKKIKNKRIRKDVMTL